MKHLQKGSYKVTDPEKYYSLVQSGEIEKECEIRGNHLVSLKRLSEDEWEYEAILDTTNPRVDELATLLEDKYSIKYSLTSAIKLEPVDNGEQKILKNLKKEIKKVKEDLLTVT